MLKSTVSGVERIKSYVVSVLDRKSVSKQLGAILMVLALLSVLPTFNFQEHSTEQSYFDTVQAENFTDTKYHFNDGDYLAFSEYKSTPDIKDQYAMKSYSVEPGDTISTIASKFNIKTSTVLGANGKTFGEIIKPGENLKILPTDGVIHKVKSGESFASLVKKYDVTEKVIRRVNNKVDGDILKIDEELLIPGVEYSVPEISRSQNIYIAGRSGGYVQPIKKTYSNLTGGRLLTPATGIITQPFHNGHPAIDIANKLGTTIFAAESGRVKLVSVGTYGNGYGNHVIIDHGNGMETLYAHMQTVYVTKGQQVVRGESIGAMGSTGRSTGPHLHFEVRDSKKGYKMNPAGYL